MQDESPAPASAAPSIPADPAQSGLSLVQLFLSLAGDLPGLLSDRVHLLSLELRRAGIALAQIVGLVVAMAVLAVTAWAALWVGAAAALLAWGLHLGWVVVLVVLLNLGAAAAAAWRVRALASVLGLPATVRRLTIPKPPPASASTTSAGPRAA